MEQITGYRSLLNNFGSPADKRKLPDLINNIQKVIDDLVQLSKS